MITRSYSELCSIKTYEERLMYLRLDAKEEHAINLIDRFTKQRFYQSKMWKHARYNVIVRDSGCDLAIRELEIMGPVFVHHMNPIEFAELVHGRGYQIAADPEYLITVSRVTHESIHHGALRLLLPPERKPNDTCPWKL